MDTGRACKFLLFLFALSAPYLAQGMDYSGFRRSSNVEDRRGSSRENAVLYAQEAAEASAVLKRLTSAAGENSFPFHCAAFKAVRAGFEKLKPETDLITDYSSALERADIGATLDLKQMKNPETCGAARSEEAAKLSHALEGISGLHDMILNRDGDARKSAQAISSELRMQPPGSKMESYLNQDCGEARQIAEDALFSFVSYSGELLSQLDAVSEELQQESRFLSNNVICGRRDSSPLKN